MSEDLRQNIIVTAYLLFSHNALAVAYTAGLAVSVALAYFRPSRFATLLTVAFALLLFGFEYDKHIVEGFREQTIKSFITIEPHFRLQRIIDLVISDLLPIFFFLGGWTLLFAALVYASKHINHKSKGKGHRG